MNDENKSTPNPNDGLEGLLALLNRIPKTTISMLNVPRYAEAVRSITQIVKFVKEDFPEAEATVEFDGITGTTLMLTIVTEGANIYKIKDFCQALSVASTMDIVPLNDGKVHIGFTYKQAKIFVPPAPN